MANEVTILVKAKNEAKPVIAEVRRDVQSLGRTVTNTTRNIERMGAASTGTARRQSTMGTETRNVTRRVTDQGDAVDRLQGKLNGLGRKTHKVKVDVDKDGGLLGGKGSGLLDKFGDFGGKLAEQVGGTFAKLLPGAIGVAAQGAGISTQLGAALAPVAAIIGTVIASFVGTALISGILLALGGGVLAAGIAGALKDQKVKDAINGKTVVVGRHALNERGDKSPNAASDVTQVVGGIVPKIKEIYAAFSKPFIDPLVRALELFESKLGNIAPKAAELGEKFAPIIDKLAPALLEMAERAWPGIVEALDASIPLFDTIAEHLPVIGEAISKFFSVIADYGPEAQQVLGVLLSMFSGLIVILGGVLGLMGLIWRKLGDLGKHIGDSVNWGKNAFSGLINSLGTVIGMALRAIGLLDRLNGTVTGSARTLGTGVSAGIGAAAGGPPRRATGGIAGGLTQVAERGGELLKLPQGTMVYAAGQSQHMMQTGQAGGGRGGKLDVTIRFAGGGASGNALAEWFMEAQRAGDITINANAIA